MQDLDGHIIDTGEQVALAAMALQTVEEAAVNHELADIHTRALRAAIDVLRSAADTLLDVAEAYQLEQFRNNNKSN